MLMQVLALAEYTASKSVAAPATADVQSAGNQLMVETADRTEARRVAEQVYKRVHVCP